MKQLSLIATGLSALLAIAAFQNCSQSDFAKTAADNESLGIAKSNGEGYSGKLYVVGPKDLERVCSSEAPYGAILITSSGDVVLLAGDCRSNVPPVEIKVNEIRLAENETILVFHNINYNLVANQPGSGGQVEKVSCMKESEIKRYTNEYACLYEGQNFQGDECCIRRTAQDVVTVDPRLQNGRFTGALSFKVSGNMQVMVCDAPFQNYTEAQECMPAGPASAQENRGQCRYERSMGCSGTNWETRGGIGALGYGTETDPTDGKVFINYARARSVLFGGQLIESGNVENR